METAKLTIGNLPKFYRKSIETDFCTDWQRRYTTKRDFNKDTEYEKYGLDYWKNLLEPDFKKIREMEIKKIPLSIAQICEYAHSTDHPVRDDWNWTDLNPTVIAELPTEKPNQPYFVSKYRVLFADGFFCEPSRWLVIFFNAEDLDNGNIYNFNHLVAHSFFDANKKFFRQEFGLKEFYIRQYTRHFFRIGRGEEGKLENWNGFDPKWKNGVAEINLDYFADLVD